MTPFLSILVVVLATTLHAYPNHFSSADTLLTSISKPHNPTKNFMMELSGGSSVGNSVRISDEDDEDDDGEEDDDEFGSRDEREVDNENDGDVFGSSSSSGEEGQTAKVQFMVTGRMRQVLTEELGYLSSEVDMIEPQIAAVVIERGLARPSAGMPASWRKTNVARAVARRPGNIRTRSVSGIVNALKRPLTLIPLLITATYLIIQSGSAEPMSKFKLPSRRKHTEKKPMTRLNIVPSASPSPSRSKNNRNSGIDVNSMESLQGKGYNAWLDKLR